MEALLRPRFQRKLGGRKEINENDTGRTRARSEVRCILQDNWFGQLGLRKMQRWNVLTKGINYT
jgi:hypothetical protein